VPLTHLFRARHKEMNSVVQESGKLRTQPATSAPNPVSPVLLTAQTLLRGRRDIATSLRQERYDLRYVATWSRLPEAVDRIQADVVLVDIDAADLLYDGVQNLSGYRLVTLLARQLARRPVAIVVMTKLDFAEIEELGRSGVHAIVSPEIGGRALVDQLRIALDKAHGRHVPQTSEQDTAPPASLLEKRPPSLPAAPDSDKIDDGWRLPDQAWQRIEELLPVVKHPERIRANDRRAVDAVLLVLRSGIPWSRLPKSLGQPATARRRLQRWGACGILEEILVAGLDALHGWEPFHWDRLAPVLAPAMSPLKSPQTENNRSRKTSQHAVYS
jgi:transposase/DNA-binding NarL/FixJ family response regulator